MRRMRYGLSQPAQRFAIFLAGALDDLARQLRTRRALVPVERFQVVAHVLLVERRRAAADAARCRPARSAMSRVSAPHRSASELPCGSTPNSNLVSAMMMPRRARMLGAQADRAPARLRAPPPRAAAPISCAAVSNEMFSSCCARRRLGGRREDRCRQLPAPAAGPRAARCRRWLPLRLIVLPARTDQVAAHHRFDRQRAQALDDHRAACEQLALGGIAKSRELERSGRSDGWARCARCARTRTARSRSAPALARNRIGQHDIECRQPIGGDDQHVLVIQRVACRAPCRDAAASGPSESVS